MLSIGAYACVKGKGRNILEKQNDRRCMYGLQLPDEQTPRVCREEGHLLWLSRPLDIFWAMLMLIIHKMRVKRSGKQKRVTAQTSTLVTGSDSKAKRNYLSNPYLKQNGVF